MKRMSFYVRSEVVDSISLVRITVQSGQGETQGDCVLDKAKVMKSCAVCAASFVGLESLRLIISNANEA